MKLCKEINKLINESKGNLVIEVNNRYKKYFNNEDNIRVKDNFVNALTSKTGWTTHWDSNGSFIIEAPESKVEEVTKIVNDSLTELRKTASSLGEAHSDDKAGAIAYYLSHEKYSDKELANLLLMAKGEHTSDTHSAKKILDKLQHDLKYTIDGFGLKDVAVALTDRKYTKK